MKGFDFTEHVRVALARAREEAVALEHPYVAPQHQLLGVLSVDDAVANIVLGRLGVERGAVSERVRKRIERGLPGSVREPDLPYTSRAKRALELAMSEARELHHNFVGTEHLLLGMLREEKNIAADVLLSFGVTAEKARTGLLAIIEEWAASIRDEKSDHDGAPG